jgi:ribosomal protein S18 acetylase RimI-like enzyme
MNLQIRPLVDDDVEAVVQLSLRAWEPVFASFRQVLGDAIYLKIYPDWTTQQRAAVEAGCRAPEGSVWVAEVDGSVAGFITYKLNMEAKTGEVEFLAVDPAYQNRGIGTALNTFVLGKMRESGILLAEVGTGGDPGHAAARRSYEKAGYTALPIVRYYQDLTQDDAATE